MPTAINNEGIALVNKESNGLVPLGNTMFQNYFEVLCRVLAFTTYRVF